MQSTVGECELLYLLMVMVYIVVSSQSDLCVSVPFISPEANKHDFRGYYGLGHTYEMLRMSYFALYYYKQAHRLR